MKKRMSAAGDAIAAARRLGGVRGARALDALSFRREDAAELTLHAALLFDASGREAEAVPRYRRALAAGLSGRPRRDALVCLASSLDTLGRSASALATMRRARREFPDDLVVSLFHASMLRSVGQTDRAFVALAEIVLRHVPSAKLEGYDAVLARKLRQRRWRGAAGRVRAASR